MRFTHALGALILGAGCTLLGDCASLRPANDLFADTQDTDTNITRYQSRFSTRYMQNNAEQNAIGSFLWRERGPNVQLELMSSLDQALAIVSQSNQGVILELPNQPPHRTPGAGMLMQDTLGFSLPVSGLRDRLHARPVPSTPACVVHDAQSHPETIEQNGWAVHYVAWTDDGSNTDSAEVGVRRLDLDRPRDTNSPLSVRPVFDR